MNCGYCRDCKWWISDAYEDEESWTTCGNPNRKVRTGSNHDVLTEPDFGCIQFEEKPKE